MQNKSQNISQAQQWRMVTNTADKTMGPRAAWPHTLMGQLESSSSTLNKDSLLIQRSADFVVVLERPFHLGLTKALISF